MELRPERYLQVLRAHLTLTPRERRVLLFVLVSLATGTALRWLGWLQPLPQAPMTHEPSHTQNTAGVSAGSMVPPEAHPKVALNQADFTELLSLPGIGPHRARNLLEYRRRHGPFREWNDLLAVPGIGPKTLERIRPYATLDP